MGYCLNPSCPNPSTASNFHNGSHKQALFWRSYFLSRLAPWTKNKETCPSCGTELLLKGRYRGVRLLGQGNFGKTFEVDDRGTPKVLKVLCINHYPKAVEIFQREAKVLSELHYPGIPKVEPNSYFTFPGGAEEVFHCLPMEKIDGQNLQEWLLARDNQPITQEQAIEWLRQLVEILVKVHQKCFHRDIKPANIMLKPDGRLVLIDFGAVREITETYFREVERSKVTQLVSPGYTPTEQYEGAAVPQSDFFALGRTFVHLLTGQHPRTLPKDSADNLIWRDQARHVSHSFANLIDKLMATKPENRPQNTQEILAKLQAIQTQGSNLHPLTALSFIVLVLLGGISIYSSFPWISALYRQRGFEDYLCQFLGTRTVPHLLSCPNKK